MIHHTHNHHLFQLHTTSCFGERPRAGPAGQSALASIALLTGRPLIVSDVSLFMVMIGKLALADAGVVDPAAPPG
jgi:hypothetical protein